MNTARFQKSISVELRLTTNADGTSLNFLDVPQLRGKYVQGIEAFTDAQVKKTMTQTDVIADAGKTGLLVNIVVDSDTILENLPYYTLIATYNGGLIRQFKNIKININKSNIYIGNGTFLVSGTSAFFTFYYTDQPL
jgi:hypothetical protein